MTGCQESYTKGLVVVVGVDYLRIFTCNISKTGSDHLVFEISDSRLSDTNSFGKSTVYDFLIIYEKKGTIFHQVWIL